MLHNRGAGFRALTDGAHPNNPAPGRRPFHTIIPSLVRRGGSGRWGALGVTGGQFQPQGHVQVLHHLACGLDVQAAIDAPRWHWVGGTMLGLEAGLLGLEPEFARARPHDRHLSIAAVRCGPGGVADRRLLARRIRRAPRQPRGGNVMRYRAAIAAIATTTAITISATAPSAGAATVPKNDAASFRADAELLARIPDGVRETCLLRDTTFNSAPGDHYVAFLECHPDPATTITYQQYERESEMSAAFTNRFARRRHARADRRGRRLRVARDLHGRRQTPGLVDLRVRRVERCGVDQVDLRATRGDRNPQTLRQRRGPRRARRGRTTRARAPQPTRSRASSRPRPRSAQRRSCST